MKAVWSQYIKAKKEAEATEFTPHTNYHKRRSLIEEENRRKSQEARQRAQCLSEEMEPHCERALRLLTRIFIKARDSFLCLEHKLLPDRFDSWLVPIHYSV